jgi:hypothetical protein
MEERFVLCRTTISNDKEDEEKYGMMIYALNHAVYDNSYDHSNLCIQNNYIFRNGVMMKHSMKLKMISYQQ